MGKVCLAVVMLVGDIDPAIGSTIIRNVSKTRTSRIYPLRSSCTQVAGTLASGVLEADRAGVLLLLLFAMIRSVAKSFKVPGVEVVASRMSNEAALTRMIDSTPKTTWSYLTLVLDG